MRALIQIFLISYLLGLAVTLSSQTLDEIELENIKRVLLTENPELISEIISYPIKRLYPLAQIQNRIQFIEKFEEIFDSNFFNTIARVDTGTDWSLMGWRGTMLNNGILWITEDYKIRAINYSSELGNQNRNSLIQLQAEELPSEQKEFDEPILNWYTEAFQIRVDKISGEYRLNIWAQNSNSILLKTINNGRRRADGNIGSYFIYWQSDNYVSILYNSADGVGESFYREYERLENSDGTMEWDPVDYLENNNTHPLFQAIYINDVN